MLEWQQELADPDEFVGNLKGELDEDEEDVFVFTPEGEVRSLASGATPLDFAYEIHTELGHRCVGAKVNGKLVPLGYELRSGDRVEVLTGRRERGPSRDWLAMVTTTRARKKITQWFSAESREDAERKGREMLQAQLRSADLPVQKSPARRCWQPLSARWAFAGRKTFTSRSVARRSRPRSSLQRSSPSLAKVRPPSPSPRQATR